MVRLILFILLIIGYSYTSGQSRKELEARKTEALRNISTAKELLSDAARKKQISMKRLQVIGSTIHSRNEMIRNISSEIQYLDQRIDSLERTIADLNFDINKGKEEYEKIIISIYKSDTHEEKIMYLLASKNINEFYQRIKYIKYLNDYREKKVAEIENLVINYEEVIEEMEFRLDEKEALLDAKEKEQQQLVIERNQRKSLISKLSRNENALEQRIRKNRRISNALDERINEMIEAEARASANNNLFNTLTPEQKLIGSDFENNRGRLPWPVAKGVITTKYGLINHPVLEGVKISNNGIDISASEGTKARALFDGEVTGVSAILGANYVVLIMHGEYITVYQNLVNLKVKVGDKVSAKQEIGEIHSDPEDHIAVMHLQIRKQKEPMDPESWLSK